VQPRRPLLSLRSPLTSWQGATAGRGAVVADLAPTRLDNPAQPRRPDATRPRPGSLLQRDLDDPTLLVRRGSGGAARIRWWWWWWCISLPMSLPSVLA
jgi:hypothetical protein